MKKSKPKAIPRLTEYVCATLITSNAPLSSRRIMCLAGIVDDQQPNVSSVLSRLMKKGLVQVEFGSDPFYPKTDRLYVACDKKGLQALIKQAI